MVLSSVTCISTSRSMIPCQEGHEPSLASSNPEAQPCRIMLLPGAMTVPCEGHIRSERSSNSCRRVRGARSSGPVVRTRRWTTGAVSFEEQGDLQGPGAFMQALITVRSGAVCLACQATQPKHVMLPYHANTVRRTDHLRRDDDAEEPVLV